MAEYYLALVGNPNCGKSTLFNKLTGLNQKIGNYSGVTLEKKTGFCKLNNGKTAEIIDLPGIFSLKQKNTEEQIVASELLDPSGKVKTIVYLADANHLEKSLLLFSQLKETGIPIILALNMLDIAGRNGKQINLDVLSRHFDVPVVEINAQKGSGIEKLKAVLCEENRRHSVDFEPINLVELNKNLLARFEKNHLICKEAVSFNTAATNSIDLDKFLLHPILGYAVFLGILLGIFWMIFSLAEYPMRWIEMAFEYSQGQLKSAFPENLFFDLIIEGIIPGIGGIVVFVPQIALLFLAIGLLEQSGYLSRASFLLDKIMKQFGMSGHSIIPLMSGWACAIPAIMSARMLKDRKDRIITMLVLPFMTCSARLPVYVLLVGLLIAGNESVLGLGMASVFMLGLYGLGTMAALISAKILSKKMHTTAVEVDIQEIPPYRIPLLENVLINAWLKVKSFIMDAGKIILVFSVIIWLMGNFGMDSFSTSYRSETKSAKTSLENSFLGQFGKKIEPAFKPLGMDWKIGIGVLSSFAAREVFVGTISTIFKVENPDDHWSIREKIKRAYFTNTKEGTAMVWSILIFYVFAMQCFSTLAITKQVFGSWKYPVAQFFVMTGLAYGCSFFTYNFILWV